MIVSFIPNTGPSTAFENRIAPDCMIDFSLDNLYDALRENVVSADDKTAGHFIIPCEFVTSDYVHARDNENNVLYQKNGDPFIQRAAENVKYVTMLPADFDDGMTLEEAQERFKDYSYIIYTSFNHLIDGETPKFRMLFPIESPVSPDEIRNRKGALHDFLGPVDKTTLYVSRGFYTPTISEDNKENFFMGINYGKSPNILEFDKVVPVPYVPSNTELSDSDMQEIKEMLRETTITSYERWWQMVQAMKSCGYTESDLMDVSADNFNHISPSTGIKDAAQCSSTYRVVNGGYGEGMGKLVVLIRDGGYPDFRKSKSATQCELEKRLEKLSEIKIKRLKRKLK